MKAWAIGNLFGVLWAVMGVSALPESWRTSAGVVLAAIAGLLVAVRLRGRREAPIDGDRMFGRRAYLVAVALEIAAIALATWLLPRVGANGLLPNVVGVIVGLHFIGLAMASGQKRLYAVTAAMCAVSLATIPLSAHPVDWRSATLGIGNALVLWLAANLMARRRPA